jgi:membrane glycosyltransferase
VPGVVIIILAMVLVGPVAVMLVGAAWSALFGWMVGNDADQRAEGQPA